MGLGLRFLAVRKVAVFEGCMTNNLVPMAIHAELYDVLWRPEEKGFDTAEKMIQPLRYGIALLESNADYFKQFNPENGWGSYTDLLVFAKTVLAHCIENPDSEPCASR